MAKTGIVTGFILSWVRAVGELGATMMMAYNPHTISIQIFEDNAIGGLRNAIPDIMLVFFIDSSYSYVQCCKEKAMARGIETWVVNSLNVVLELINLTKKFVGFTLGPLNLKVNYNEILVMIGPTGSGKTTVLNLIAGLLKPDGGIGSC